MFQYTQPTTAQLLILSTYAEPPTGHLTPNLISGSRSVLPVDVFLAVVQKGY